VTGAGPHPEVRDLDDLRGDLAATHRSLRADRDVEPAEVDQSWAVLQEQGYVIIEGAIDDATCDAVGRAVAPLLDATGRNAFEGHLTRRLYSVLTKTRAVDALVEAPLVLALLDRLLQPGYLLSQLQVIELLPGETEQLLHPDDGFYAWPRPRPPLGAATVWAIDDFTADNGATVVIPGSHRWGQDRVPTDADERVAAVMPAGSVVLFLGTLWHGGGANRSHRPRLAVTAQYCEPWLRQQESFLLSVDRATARRLSPQLRSMIGYSIHPPFMGMVDGMHPARLLG
jgi:hypothetical protein